MAKPNIRLSKLNQSLNLNLNNEDTDNTLRSFHNNHLKVERLAVKSILRYNPLSLSSDSLDEDDLNYDHWKD